MPSGRLKTEKPTKHARLHLDSHAALRTMAAMRGVTIAQIVDQLVTPLLPEMAKLGQALDAKVGMHANP